MFGMIVGWLCSWARLAEGIVGILSLGRFTPYWGLAVAKYFSKRRGQLGDKGVRDPEYPCPDFDPSPLGLGALAECEGDGHYLCKKCKYLVRVQGGKDG